MNTTRLTKLALLLALLIVVRFLLGCESTGDDDEITELIVQEYLLDTQVDCDATKTLEGGTYATVQLHPSHALFAWCSDVLRGPPRYVIPIHP